MSYLEILRDRGLIAQITHETELVEHLKTPQTAYIGFDPTATSLHIGNLLALLMARRWQRAGHRILILVGGGTAMVGDPSGKTDMRSMSTVEEIDSRARLMQQHFSRYIDFSNPEKGLMVNNADWLRKLEYMPFLREIGVHFNVNRMLDAECFKQRMEKGLSFLEFNYMIFQAYDFLELNKRYNCTLQLGGDDQWSNMLAGVDLVRKVRRTKAFCLTNPLLINSNGQKMGKTEKGALWLDETMTSVFDFFQYFRNVDDQDVGKILRYLTDLPMDEVRELESLPGEKINEAKVRAAYEITREVHGEEKARKAQETAEAIFARGAGAEAPEVLYGLPAGSSDAALLDILAETKLCPSKGEARRLIQQGGVQVNSKIVSDDKFRLEASALQDGVVVQLGKKRFFKIKVR